MKFLYICSRFIVPADRGFAIPDNSDRGIYFAKYYGGGGEWLLGKKNENLRTWGKKIKKKIKGEKVKGEKGPA